MYYTFRCNVCQSPADGPINPFIVSALAFVPTRYLLYGFLDLIPGTLCSADSTTDTPGPTNEFIYKPFMMVDYV